MKSDINVTPLVDVCLVLLIIFMAVTDELSHGKRVTLPAATTSATSQEDLRRRPTYVQADADLPYGEVYPVLLAVREAGASNLSLGTRSFDP
jgi:biopolymer transport protein ExbD